MKVSIPSGSPSIFLRFVYTDWLLPRIHQVQNLVVYHIGDHRKCILTLGVKLFVSILWQVIMNKCTFVNQTYNFLFSKLFPKNVFHYYVVIFYFLLRKVFYAFPPTSPLQSIIFFLNECIQVPNAQSLFDKCLRSICCPTNRSQLRQDQSEECEILRDTPGNVMRWQVRCYRNSVPLFLLMTITVISGSQIFSSRYYESRWLLWKLEYA